MSIVVIGGGVIGCSAAHELARLGEDVVVIDMREPGHGATLASAGMLAPYIEGHDAALLGLGVESLSRYDDFVAGIEHASGRRIEYARAGTLQAARTSAHVTELTRAVERLKDAGVRHTLLTGVDARALEPALAADVLSALLIEEHGYVHAGQLMDALVRAAVRHGARFVSDRAVAIESDRDDLRVVCAGGSHVASRVVVAAGSWSSALLGAGHHGPIRPIRGQSIELRPAVQPLSRVVWGDDCYMVPWRNGSVIVGATVEDVGFDESSTPEAVRGLRAAACAVVPSLASAPLGSVRVGLRPATSDGLPVVGWSPLIPGVCVATGHYRNGILLAPLTAAVVSELVLGTATPALGWAREALAPSRLGG